MCIWRHKTYAATGLTFEEFLTRFENVHAEYWQGNVEVIATNNTQHQAILLFLSVLLELFLSVRSLGKLLPAGIPMHVGQGAPTREPDLMVLLNGNPATLHSTYLEGAADIVVEIVSPEATTVTAASSCASTRRPECANTG